MKLPCADDRMLGRLPLPQKLCITGRASSAWGVGAGHKVRPFPQKDISHGVVTRKTPKEEIIHFCKLCITKDHTWTKGGFDI